MKKREMFVFVSLDPPHASLDKGGMRACLEFLPFGESGPPFPSPLYMSDLVKPSGALE